MATTTVNTSELVLELENGSGATRSIKIDNPDTETYTTRAEVEDAISSALFPATSADGSVKTGFFCDDYDPTAALTALKSVSFVRITKSVTEYQ